VHTEQVFRCNTQISKKERIIKKKGKRRIVAAEIMREKSTYFNLKFINSKQQQQQQKAQNLVGRVSR
jgi:hypothetical protein